jgi:hypothetical protein
VIQEADFDYFKLGLFHQFSLHATSDMYWAGQRLGKEREKMLIYKIT